MKSQAMKALTFKRYGKSPEIGLTDVHGHSKGKVVLEM